LLHTFPGCQGPILFSQDARRFAASRPGPEGDSLVVWEVPSGREIAALFPPPGPWGWGSPMELSPDGTLLVDSVNRVWEVDTGKERFQLPGAPQVYGTFAADGRSLVLPRWTGSGGRVIRIDPATGGERAGPNAPVRSASQSRGEVFKATPDGRLLLCDSWWLEAPNPAQKQLAQLPVLARLNDYANRQRYELIEEGTGKVVAQGDTLGLLCSPDGRLLLTQDVNGPFVLWDVPPARPWGWFLTALAGLPLAPAILVGWCVRRWRAPPRPDRES